MYLPCCAHIYRAFRQPFCSAVGDSLRLTCGLSAGWHPLLHSGRSGDAGRPLLRHCTERIAVPLPQSAEHAPHSLVLQKHPEHLHRHHLKQSHGKDSHILSLCIVSLSTFAAGPCSFIRSASCMERVVSCGGW